LTEGKVGLLTEGKGGLLPEGKEGVLTEGKVGLLPARPMVIFMRNGLGWVTVGVIFRLRPVEAFAGPAGTN
jgi:hypothetical protein